jgi:hypothetical protein
MISECFYNPDQAQKMQPETLYILMKEPIMKRSEYICFLMILHFIYTISLHSHSFEFDKFSLWTESTKLRGANIHQRRVYPELDGLEFMGPDPFGPPYFQEDFYRMSEWGANLVNLSHPGLFSESPPFVLDSAVQDNLDALLTMIAQAGMYAIISFRTGPGRSEFTFVWDEVGDWFDESYLNDTVWEDPSSQNAWVEMWRYTAEKYKDNPIIVGYDLMVEPNSNEVGSDAANPLNIWDPDEFYDAYGGTLYDCNQLYLRITDAIREKDTDTPILIGGNAYSRISWLPYLELTGDSRTVYMVHQYEPHMYTHQWPKNMFTYPGEFDTDYDGQPDQFNRAWLEDLVTVIDDFMQANHVPVAVNEFGVMRWIPGAAEYLNDLMALLEARHMNHALWLWDPSWEAHAVDENSFNFRHGPDPENHSDVQTSELIEVIKSNWSKNTEFPTLVGESDSQILPITFGLEQNYPNPFNAATIIPFCLSRDGHAEISLFDVRGRKITTLLSTCLPKGTHSIQWNANNSKNGVYLCQMKIIDQPVDTKTIKLILLK